MSSRIGRPERPAGLPILLAILTAWIVGVPAVVLGLLWLATVTQSAP